MGATGWLYFTEYYEDIQNALNKLRLRVFESEMYNGTAKYFKTENFGLWDALPPVKQAYFEQELIRLESLPKPISIEEAISRTEGDGTHSILDIKFISDVPDFDTASPLSSSELIKLFNTDKPTREMIEKINVTVEVKQYRHRWQAAYILLYKDGYPSEILFTGSTGD